MIARGEQTEGEPVRPTVILSPEGWSEDAPTNKHQVARVLARHRTVYFVDVNGRSPRLGSRPLVRRRTVDGVQIVEPLGLPQRLQNRFQGVADLQHLWAVAATRNALRADGVTDFFSVIFYFPYSKAIRRVLRAGIEMYHCVDDHSSFPLLSGRRRSIDRAEKSLLAEADIVAASSAALAAKCRFTRRDTSLLLNVGDVELYGRAARQVLAARPQGRLRVFFHGNLSAHKIDYALLRDLAREVDVDLTVLGQLPDAPAHALIGELVRQGVDYHPPARPSDVVDQLASCDVLLLPYRLSEHTAHVFPLKLTEYLATGKPIVATRLPSVVEFCSDSIEYCASSSDIVRALSDDLLFDPVRRERRLQLAKGRSWELRSAEIEALLDAASLRGAGTSV